MTWRSSCLTCVVSRVQPTAQEVMANLGSGSLNFRYASDRLHRLYQQARDHPQVQVRFREWRRYLDIVYGEALGAEDLFTRHTYLAIVARLIALFHLEPQAVPISQEEVAGVINGDFFRQRDLYNFIEDDFFTWFLTAPIATEGIELVRRLLDALSSYDFRKPQQDLLKGLYQELVDPKERHDLGESYTPDWLAEYMLAQELRLQDNPGASVLDPACGSGTFLFIAIRLKREALEKQGMEPFEVLLNVTSSVMGMDVHPVAVTIARTNYLLALGDLLQGPRPEVIIPVYLTDAIQLPAVSDLESREERVENREEGVGGREKGGTPPRMLPMASRQPEPVYTVQTEEPGVVFEVPDSVASDQRALDWLFFRVVKYLKGAAFRVEHQLRRKRKASESDPSFWVGQEVEEAVSEVIGSWYAYLRSPKKAGGVQLQPLSQFAADVMCNTARILIRLHLEGKDTVWVHIVKNSLASTYLSRRKFDYVVGNPPWLSVRNIKSPRYYEFVRRQVLEEYKLLEREKTHLFPHMELAALFYVRCADLYLKEENREEGRGGGTIAFVMPRSVLTPDRRGAFTAFSFKGGELKLKLVKVLDLDQVEPLFNVPACVLIAHKGQETTLRQGFGEPSSRAQAEGLSRTAQGSAYTVEGLVFQGSPPSRNASWQDAQPHLRWEATQYERKGDKLSRFSE